MDFLLGAKVNLLYDDNIVVISNPFVKSSNSNLIDLWLTDNRTKSNSFDYERELKGAVDILDNLKIPNFTIRIPFCSLDSISNTISLLSYRKDISKDIDDVQLIYTPVASSDNYILDYNFKISLVKNEEDKLIWKEIDECKVNYANHLSEFNKKYLFYYEKDPIGCFETIETKLSGQTIVGIYSIKIIQKHRGKGFGSKMLTEFIKSQQNKIFYLQTWDKNPALEFYKRLDFREIYRYKRFALTSTSALWRQ